MRPLTLSTRSPFAKGGRRLCFVHPEQPEKCVKVLRKDIGRFVKTGRTLVPASLRREYDNNEDERRALRALERQLDNDYRHLPRCDGYTPTDLGDGLVLDLVRDVDGRISRSVREALRDGISPEELKPAYEEMTEYFIERRVVTRAILDHNITAQDLGDGRWRMTLIDGFGDRAWIPLRSFVPCARRATAKKRARNGWDRILKIAADVKTGVQWDRTRWGQGILDHRGDDTIPGQEGKKTDNANRSTDA